MRVLLVNEFSLLNSGYSTFGHELLKRLYASEKYELAELACYAGPNHPGIASIPWKVYPNEPRDPEGIARYNADRKLQFGAFSFNDVCLDFRPDVVVSARDWWMDSFIENSPFREMFRWVEMPTVDSAPQQEQWLATYANADAVLCYSDWGVDVLRREGGGLINVVGSASPGVDTETFAPMDRAEARGKLMLDPNALILGYVSRNQQRKLFPNLVTDFSTFLRKAPKEIASRAYLYFHTSYPDVGWDLPKLVKNSGISHKILLTYKCRSCTAVTPRFYADARASCQACGELASGLPNVETGLERKSLALIFNTFDAYVQYASCEGFGMSQVEAAACGVPVFAVDYSAMSDVVRKVGGYPIKPLTLQTDVELGSKRAIPDGDDFVSQLIAFFSLSERERGLKGKDARQGVLKYYTWDRTAASFMDVFDGFPPRPQASTWESPPRHRTPLTPPTSFPTREEMVRWAITHRLCRPELVDGYLAMRLVRDLNWGVRGSGGSGSYLNEDCLAAARYKLPPFGPDDVIREFDKLREEFNHWEDRRCELLTTGT